MVVRCTCGLYDECVSLVQCGLLAPDLKPPIQNGLRLTPPELPPTPKLRVYGASGLADAALWISLHSWWPEIIWTARWPLDHINPDGTPKWPHDEAHSRVFWDHDYEDVFNSDVVLVHNTPNKVLRGAIFEAGLAIGMGKQVVVIGDHESYSTWKYHRSVSRVANLDTARSLLRIIATSIH